ncbi:MAG: rhamnan synthesis F family protein [Lachnospiraceae bacterium]|nr:rhamnan synthesis F family protein [Lachnospiraceae bacterium]
MGKRIIVAFGVNIENNRAFDYLKSSLKNLADVILYEYYDKAIDFSFIKKSAENEGANGVIFVNDRIYGPVKDLAPMFKEFDACKEDVVGLILQPPFSEGTDEVFNEGISTECFKLSHRILIDDDIEKIFTDLVNEGESRFKRTSEPGIIELIRKAGYTVSGLINKRNFADFTIDSGYDYVKNKNYELLKDTVCPFIFKRCFESDNNISDNLNRAISHAGDSFGYDIDVMLDDVARTVNPLDIKRNLNLNYIIPASYRLYNKLDEQIYDETAVFAHIFYVDRVDNSFEYLDHVPPQVRKYLTTSNPETYELIRGKLSERDDKWSVRLIKNRGRDVGALWVSNAPLIKNYKYICFLHDKKTSGQTGNILNGDYYHYNVWENCLKNTDYINNVLYTLSETPKLGFLSPPFPIFFDYKGLLGGEWTNCYDVTLELAKDLNIKADIRTDKPPFAFSNSFWARTDALMPLVDRKLRFEDFPAEPLPIDGSISHAIERIYIYSAQSQGYFSGILENDQYASMELNSMQKIMANMNVKYNRMFNERNLQSNRADRLQKEKEEYKNALDKVAEIINNTHITE